MTATLMLGSDVSEKLWPGLHRGFQEILRIAQPSLTAITLGESEASELYLRNKKLACERLGIEFDLIRLPSTTNHTDLILRLQHLNQASSVQGIFVQLPLPPPLDPFKYEIFDAINPAKDVDGISGTNAIAYYRGGIGYHLPATVRGVMEMMLHYGITTEGKHVLVTGRNDITGKAFAIVLGGRAGGAFAPGLGNAQITWGNRFTPTGELIESARRADVIVSCAGTDPKPLGRLALIPSNAVKQGSAIFDVALRQDRSDGLVGDVEPGAVKHAAFITPVPGGVGPMTVTALMENLLDATKYATGTKLDRGL